MTRTQQVLERDSHRCQYCGGRAIHADHLIPVALRRRHHLSSTDIDFMTAACGPCNWRKGTRRLVPVSWADRLTELPGRGWRTWDGSVEALRVVVK